MGLLDFIRKGKTEIVFIDEPENSIADDPALDKLIKEIKRLTRREAVRLVFKKQKGVSPLKSKLGGAPYSESGTPYPPDSKGRPMLLLLQLNLAEIELETALPEEGLLQFFIGDNMETECKVIYRKSVSAEKHREAFNAALPDSSFSPVLQECAVSFEKCRDYICVNDKSFDSVFHTAYKNVTGNEITGDIYDNFSDSDCRKICEAFSGRGSKLFGYPCFTQTDPRSDSSEEELLLQIDSDDRLTMWGDYGAGNFFISDDKLKEQDFSDVLYSWDCF